MVEMTAREWGIFWMGFGTGMILPSIMLIGFGWKIRHLNSRRDIEASPSIKQEDDDFRRSLKMNLFIILKLRNGLGFLHL